MTNEFEIIASEHIRNFNIVFNRVKYRSPHMHREFEFIYHVAGRTQYHLGAEVKTLAPGDFLIFNPYQMHEITSIDDNSFIICLQVAPEFFEMFYPQIHRVEFDVSFLDDWDPTEIGEMALRLAKSYLMQRPYYEFECATLIGHIFYKLLLSLPHHTASPAKKKTSEEKAYRLERILDYAANHYNEKINLADFAAQENLTLNYLSRFIKQNLNRSFQDYIGELRFNHAKYLICNTKQNLIDICEACGYSDYRYLYQDFATHLHCSPKAYRTTHALENPQPMRRGSSQEEILDFRQALELLT